MKTKHSGQGLESLQELLEGAKKSGFPGVIKPMLATLADQPPGEEGWLFEIKWDGYRCIGYNNNGKNKKPDITAQNILCLLNRHDAASCNIRNELRLL